MWALPAVSPTLQLHASVSLCPFAFSVVVEGGLQTRAMSKSLCLQSGDEWGIRLGLCRAGNVCRAEKADGGGLGVGQS